MHRTNVHEMAQFQLGKKHVAIISDAAAMGISLHASNRAENRQRRVHVTLELGWSADKQMQTFGRTHRSDQAVPPEYVLLSTELGGEKRFSSTIARRLGSLGALTKGDRGSADSGDLAKYNFETEEGRAALCLMLRRIVESGNVPGISNPRQTLRDIGLLVRSRDGCEEVRKEDFYNVPRFLNRVLALDVEHQNALFDHFVDLFDQTVRYAKANGTFDEGVTDIKALAIRIAKPARVVHTGEITNAQTTHYTLEIDVPSKAVSFGEAEGIRNRKTGAFFRHRNNGHFILAIESGLHTNAENGNSYRTFAIWKPEAARSSYIHDDELSEKYRAVIPSKARDWWIKKHAAVPPIDTLETHIIGGAIIPLWQRFKTHEEARLRVVRVTTDDGQRIVGIRIPPEQIGPIENERRVPLVPPITELVQARIRDGLTGETLLFKRAKVLTYDNAIGRACIKAAKIAKLNYGQANGFTCHSLRHTFITDLMIKTGGDAGTVMSYSGHKSLESFSTYLHASEKGCNLAIQALENVALFLRCFEGREGQEGHQGLETEPHKPLQNQEIAV